MSNVLNMVSFAANGKIFEMGGSVESTNPKYPKAGSTLRAKWKCRTTIADELLNASS